MGITRHAQRTPLSTFWVLAVLALGALLGIAAATVWLARQERPLAEDPDAPLFI